MTPGRTIGEHRVNGTSRTRRGLRIVARAGHPDFLDLPWELPLEDWDHDRMVEIARGVHRHVVRFVDYDGGLYALKQLSPRLAHREYRLLRRMQEAAVPVVDAVGVVSRAGMDHDGAQLEDV